MKKPLGKLKQYTQVSPQWFPVGVEMIDELDAEMMVNRRPASWLEAHMWVWLRCYRGKPPTVSQVQAWTMWSRRQASDLLNQTREVEQNWTAMWRSNETSSGTGDANNNNDLPMPAERKRNGSGTEAGRNGTHARSFNKNTDTNTNLEGEGQNAPVPAAQDKGIPKEDLQAMWETMCGIRADVFPGSQRVLALLPARADKLKACLRIQRLTPDDLVHLTRWFFTADETQWVRDKGYHFDTMLRPGNVARYYEKAQGWSPARDEADIERRLAEGF